MYEELIERLRGAHGGPDGITMCQEAADTLENQQREIEALKRIIERQAGLNQKLADMALELDTIRAERDAAVTNIKSIAQKGDAWMCPYCRHAKDTDHGFADCEIDIGQCQMPYSMFEWRGPQKEE